MAGIAVRCCATPLRRASMTTTIVGALPMKQDMISLLKSYLGATTERAGGCLAVRRIKSRPLFGQSATQKCVSEHKMEYFFRVVIVCCFAFAFIGFLEFLKIAVI